MKCLLFVVIMAASAGCNSGDDDGGIHPSGSSELRDEYIDVLVTYGMDDSYDWATPEDRPCVAGVIIDIVGLDKLAEIATPEEIRAAESDAPLDALEAEVDEDFLRELAANVGGCIDLSDAMTSSMADPDLRTCAAERIDDDLAEAIMTEVMVAELDGREPQVDPEAEEAVDEIIASCS